MRNYLKIPTLLSLMSLSLILVTPAQSQRPSSCSNDNQEQPSQRRREIINREYGLRFDIPANYYTELRRDTEPSQKLWIFVRNPTDVKFMECARRERMRGYGHQVSDVIVTIEPRPRNIHNVRDILLEIKSPNRPGVRTNIFDERFITIAGQEALIYTARDTYPQSSRVAEFIHPDEQNLVKIHAGDYGNVIDPIDLEVIDVIISSFRIDR